MTKLKLTTIGNSTGIILPKELLERLHVDCHAAIGVRSFSLQ